MFSPRCRNFIGISRKKIIFSAAVFSLFNLHYLFAQQESRYDDRLVSFGFELGVNVGKYSLTRSDTIIDSLQVLNVNRGIGVSVGAIVCYKMLEYLDLRLSPTFSLQQRDVSYTWGDSTGSSPPDKQKVESQYLEIPVLLKLKSERVGETRRLRGYVIGGFKYGHDFGSQQKSTGDTLQLKVNPNDFAAIFGVGMDIYTPFSKIAFEIKYSQGLPNLLVPENTPYALPIEALRSRLLTVSILIE